MSEWHRKVLEKTRPAWDLEHWPLGRRLVISGVAVGAAAGVSAYVLNRMTGFIWRWTVGLAIPLPLEQRWVFILLLPAVGGLLAGLIVHFISPEAKGHGVTAVMRSLRENNGAIHGRVALAKTAATAATLGFGGSAGQEGPIIQIGASVGSFLARHLGVPERDWRTLAAAGAAGGLAASFSIPLAGVFFTMEVLLKDFANEAFSAVVISSVTGTVVARTLMGKAGYLPMVSYQVGGPMDFVIFGTFAMFCALLGIAYSRALKKGELFFSRIQGVPEWTKPFLGGLMVGGVALILPPVLGTGHETISGLLFKSENLFKTGLLVPGKILATALTLGSGGSGGALLPTLFIGAAGGGFWAQLIQNIPHLPVQPGAYALVGMACVFTAVFQAPVTGMIMVFEMTQDYGILPIVMCCCVVSRLVSKSVNKKVDGTETRQAVDRLP